MEKTATSQFGYNNKVTIATSTQKVIFYNPFKPMVVKFKNKRANNIELITTGITSLCLCNYWWRESVFKKSMWVQIREPFRTKGENYYLQEVATPKGTENFLSICVKKVGEVLPLPYLCFIQIRSQNYTDCGTRASSNIESHIPNSVRRSLTVTAYKMDTYFYGPGNFEKSCTNIGNSCLNDELMDEY